MIKEFFQDFDLRAFIEENLNWQVLIGTGIDILLILLFGWIAMIIFGRLLTLFEKRLIRKGQVDGEPPSEASKRVETITRLLRQVFGLALWLVVGLVVLREVGVDVGPVLAGAGILGLAVGFGAQNLVRDVIAGFFIILENQVRVGDVAQVNGTGGLVEDINFRTIILRDLGGVVHVFPNGTIDTLSNMTKDWSAYVFEIGVAYKEDTDAVTAIIMEVTKGMREDPQFGRFIIADPEIFGVDDLGDSAVVIKGRLKTKPIKQWEVGRQFLRRIKYAFDQNGIEIPFPHRTIYAGEVTKPFDLRVLESAGGTQPLSGSSGGGGGPVIEEPAPAAPVQPSVAQPQPSTPSPAPAPAVPPSPSPTPAPSPTPPSSPTPTTPPPASTLPPANPDEDPSKHGPPGGGPIDD